MTGSSSGLQESFPSFRGMYGISLNLLKKSQTMSTCKLLDLETLRISTDYVQKFPGSDGNQLVPMNGENWPLQYFV